MFASIALAMLQQTNSLATINGWFGGTFFATPAMLTKTGAVAVAAICGPTTMTLYLAPGIHFPRRLLAPAVRRYRNLSAHGSLSTDGELLHLKVQQIRCPAGAQLCRSIPSRFAQMLPYMPSAPPRPPPALESSVLSWLTMPVLDPITLTLQNWVVAIPLPRSLLMFV
jgi:hypothetical protein